MAWEAGEVKTYNPQQQIATEIILEVLTRHRDAFKQARTGELVEKSVEQLSDNGRRKNKVRALSLIIAAQREMITISRPIVRHQSLQKWKKKYKSDEDREKHPFEEEQDKDLINMVYDYWKIRFWLKFLEYLEESIIEAEKSRTLDDDFMIEKDIDGAKVIELTANFYNMLQDLEESYESIYSIMLTNKIVSAGVEEDEEATYKELEAEAKRRILEA